MEPSLEGPNIDSIIADDHPKLEAAFRVSSGAKRDAEKFYEQMLRERIDIARARNGGSVLVTADLIPGNLVRRRITSDGQTVAEVWVDEVASGLTVGSHNETGEPHFARTFT